MNVCRSVHSIWPPNTNTRTYNDKCAEYIELKPDTLRNGIHNYTDFQFSAQLYAVQSQNKLVEKRNKRTHSDRKRKVS